MAMAAERLAMARARELGESARGATSPNPPVGAVILDVDGVIAGVGATSPAGGPHAEVVALAEAGERARRGTAVVTLEPCAHTGRTGPCTEALLAAGIARVVYAVSDPNPVAAGGADVLEAAGVHTEGGLERAEAAAGALRPWLFAMRHGRPLVTWKFAATLDGRTAAADGTSRWITGPAARADVHRLRAAVDAVLVGSGTVLADDPHLTVRLPGDDGNEALAPRQPVRAVLDRRGRAPRSARVFDAAARTIVLDAPDPRAALVALQDEGIRHVLLEGGATLAGAFVEAGCVDEVVAYIAPTLLGEGPPALGPAGIGTMSLALKMHDVQIELFGPDVRITGRIGSADDESAAQDAGAE